MNAQGTFSNGAEAFNASHSIPSVWAMLIGPHGEVRHVEVKPNIGGDVIVKLNEDGDPFIPKRWRSRGWCFYEEICSGAEDRTGTSKAKGEKHLAMWHAVRDAFAKGARPERGSIDTDRYYHPEVLRRRQLDKPDGARPMSAEELFGKLAKDVAPRATQEDTDVGA